MAVEEMDRVKVVGTKDKHVILTKDERGHEYLFVQYGTKPWARTNAVADFKTAVAGHLVKPW